MAHLLLRYGVYVHGLHEKDRIQMQQHTHSVLSSVEKMNSTT